MKAIETRSKLGTVLAALGMLAMLLLSLTQLVPSLRWAGVAVIVGVACFFLVEIITKTPKSASGMNFRTFLTDLKKPGVLFWVLLPIFTGIAPILLGDFVLHNDYSTHALGRVGDILSFDELPILIVQLLVLGLGEEIAWRGFFLGKASKKLPFWLCAVFSSVLFAMGHVADGKTLLVLYDIGFVFIDSMIFSIIFKKSGNCAVSALSHILGNAIALLFCYIVL